MIASYKARRQSASSEAALKLLHKSETYTVGGSGVAMSNFHKLVQSSTIIAPLDAEYGSVLIKISKPDVQPIHFLTPKLYFEWLIERIYLVSKSVGVKVVALEIHQVSSSQEKLEGELRIEELVSEFKDSLTKYKHILAEIHCELRPSMPNLSMLESTALDLVHLRDTFEGYANDLKKFMTDGTPFTAHTYTRKFKYSIGKDRAGAVGVGFQSAANLFVSANSATSLDYFLNIHLEFFPSEELEPLRTDSVVKSLQRERILLPVFEQLDRLLILLAKRKTDSQQAGWGFFSLPPFETPFEFVLMGPRSEGKSSIAWAIGGILPNKQPSEPSIPVRRPFSLDGATQGSRKDFIPCTSNEMPFVVVDSQGQKYPAQYSGDRHQIVILVISAKVLFEPNWTMRSNPKQILQKIAGYDDALVILLTKFDEVACKKPASNEEELADALQELWHSPRSEEYADQMAAHCSTLNDLTGKIVRAVETPINADAFALQDGDLLKFRHAWAIHFANILYEVERVMVEPDAGALWTFLTNTRSKFTWT